MAIESFIKKKLTERDHPHLFQLVRTLGKPRYAFKDRVKYLGLRVRDVEFDLFDAVLPDEPRAAETTKRILFIEDRVPHHHLGSGYPRSNEMIAELLRQGHSVTLYPMTFWDEDEASVYSDIDREVDVILREGRGGLKQFLRERLSEFDLVLVSRPHNMETLKFSLPRGRRPRIVYDAEALFCIRDIEQRRMEGSPLSPRAVRRMIRREVRLTSGSRCVISVSDAEGKKFAEYGNTKVFTLAHLVTPRPTPRPFAAREGFLFAGPIWNLQTPNGNAVSWFIAEVLPLIIKCLGPEVKFYVAGHCDPAALGELQMAGVEFLGCLDDLVPAYDRARVFVAPARFAAGVPLKIYDAAAHGVPIVTTPLLASQVSWKAGPELLVGGDAAEFATECVRLYTDSALWEGLRDNALARVTAECSRKVFADRLENIIDEALKD
ncbi:MAG: glycosyltransferase family 4 protein [Pyrinomonadaceae bacterium]